MAKRSGLARQERRRQARQREKERAFEQKYGKEIEERQERVDDRTVELYTTCIGLAIYDEYGYMPNRIHRIVTAFCNRLMSLMEPDVTYFTLQQELKEKTGVEFVWHKDDPAVRA